MPGGYRIAETFLTWIARAIASGPRKYKCSSKKSAPQRVRRDSRQPAWYVLPERQTERPVSFTVFTVAQDFGLDGDCTRTQR